MTRLIYEDVERWAALAPDQIAVHHTDDTGVDQLITYGRLAQWSNRIARVLLDRGVRPGDRVAVSIPKGPAAIASMLAAAKLGAPYVPIDPESPAARIALVLGAAEPRVVVADARAVNTVEAAIAADPDATIGTIGDEMPTWPVDPAFTAGDVAAEDGIASLPAPPISPDDLAHILFTSGSTGVPKGVMITHANVMAYVDWVVDHFGYRRDDQLSGHSPLHFDLSTMDIYATFAAGATLHPVPKRVNVNPSDLVAWIRERKLTQWFSVPSALNHMVRFDDIELGDFPSLRRLMWCGEVLPTPTLIKLMTALPHAEFTNLYGPTEATIASSWHRVEAVPADPAVSIPIGVPCEGERLVVLREDGTEADDDEIADLYIEGVGLSPGYWRDDDKTADAFRTDLVPGRRLYRTGDLASRRSDGQLVFVGRADSQIKSRGHRIELGEIEAALLTLDQLDESAIVAIDVGHIDGSAICAAYTAPRTDQAGASGQGAVRSGAEIHAPASLDPARRHAEEREREDRPARAPGRVRRCGERMRTLTVDDILDILENQLFVLVDGPDDDLVEAGELDSLRFRRAPARRRADHRAPARSEGPRPGTICARRPGSRRRSPS